jgi:hypothetical protein
MCILESEINPWSLKGTQRCHLVSCYIRQKRRWIKVGEIGTKCKRFRTVEEIEKGREEARASVERILPELRALISESDLATRTSHKKKN